MFDHPPKIHKSDLQHIKFLLESEIKQFMEYEKDQLIGMRGMARMISEIGYEVEFKVELKQR